MSDTIDKVYTEVISGNPTKLTQEQIDKIVEVAEGEASKSKDIMTLRDIQSGNIPDELKDGDDVTEEKVYANIDPRTGKISNIVNKEDIDQSSVSLDDYLDGVEAEDVEITNEAVFNSVKNTYGPELSDSEVIMLVQAINRYKNGETIRYNDMPDSIKTQISKTILEATDNSGSAIYVGNTELKNQMAREFIEVVVQESLSETIQKTMVDLQQMIDDYSKSEISKIYSSATMKQRDILEYKTLEIAKTLEDKEPEKAKLLRDVSYSFKQSYLLEDMYTMCRDTGKLRVKKIEVEKCDKTYRNFNLKYTKSKNVIKNIEFLEPILDRHLPDYIDMEYIRKFIIVFCKYCQNKDPDNIVDHIFMYYFITNITSLDLFDPNNKEDKEFYDNILSNIEKFIDLIKLKEKK